MSDVVLAIAILFAFAVLLLLRFLYFCSTSRSPFSRCSASPFPPDRCIRSARRRCRGVAVTALAATAFAVFVDAVADFKLRFKLVRLQRSLLFFFC